ncbi:MAG: hypothetical protein C0459_02955 [Chitinophaga sp.]|jgi:hypothetical protein|nr:hypothetical protein [Chitinophaga sp.]
MKKIIFISIALLFFCKTFSQQIITDDITEVVANIKSLYLKEGYTVEKTIILSKLKQGKDSVIKINCYSGKRILIAAVFDKKPANDIPESKFIINKKGKTKTFTQTFPFPEIQFNAALNAYYSLLQLQLPPEANAQNCFSELKAVNTQGNNTLAFIVMIK